jgi:uncharacterized protein
MTPEPAPASPLELLHDDPERPDPELPVVALAHGAGAGMNHPFLAAVARGLAHRGLAVVRFEFPYRAAGRRSPDPPAVLAARWREVVATLGGGSRLILAGKSLGGRIASTLADELGARGLVCLGYPFHPPGKATTAARIAHLADLATPTLFVQGTRDPFGTPDEVATYTISSAVRFLWLEDGDHSLAPRARSGFTAAGHLATALDAIEVFARERRSS